MLALGLWRDKRCHRCGGDLEETTADENDGAGLDRARYRALPPLRCYRCTALATSEEQWKDKRHPHALIHRVELIPAPRPRT